MQNHNLAKNSIRSPFCLALIAGSGLSNAAEISATAADTSIGIGDTTTVEVFLDLQGGEEASLFEGHFDLGGLGSIASVVLTPGGLSWGSSEGNVHNSQAIVSLTSANAGGSRQVATLQVTGIALGTLDISLGTPAALSAFDIPAPPFLQSLTIDTAIGTTLASVTVTDVIDTDGDGIGDNVDNCTHIANANQRDTNADGFGNICDADLNGDCIVNPVDLGLFRSVFFTNDPNSDFNGDGIVNPVDLGIFRSLFFQPPGPSAASCP